MGRIWPEWAESPKQDSWNQRKAEAAEARGRGGGLGQESQRIFCRQSWGLRPEAPCSCGMSEALCWVPGIKCGPGAVHTLGGGCLLGQVGFLAWEPILAV